MSAVMQAGAQYRPRVVAVGLVGVIGGFVVQTAVLPAVGLSAAVPVLFSVVAVLGLALGPRVGAVAGFSAGLLLDLTGVGVLGVAALAACLLGAGAARIRVDRSRWSGVAGVWAATSAAAITVVAGNAFAVGAPVTVTASAWWLVAGALVCSVVLVPVRTWVRAVVR
jgi:rod shape-determining protein MreD